MKKSTLNRMLELADIKPVIKESKMNLSNFALVKESADGNTYAIVRENKKYHIKSTQTKNSLTESEFDYVGGVANKKSFSSFEKATSHLNLMFEEINNHYDVGNVNILESDALNEKKFVLKTKKKKSAPVEEPVEEPAAEEEFDFGGDEESTEGGDEEFDFGGDEESTEGGDEEFDFDAEGDAEGGDEEFDFDAEGGDEEFDFDDEGEESVEEFGGEETDDDLEIDDSEDEIKDIQSTTGKLGQQLRDTEDITSDMQKWVAKSVLSALDLDNMDSEDKKDIIRVVKKKSDEPAEEEVESSEEEFDFEEESMEESYDSYMEDDFNEKEYDEWLSDMETAGIIEPSVGEYDDYDSYMDDVTINQTADNPQTGNLTHAWESKGKEYRQEPYDEDNPNIGGDEEGVDGELLLDDIIDDDPNDMSSIEADALYGPNSKRQYDRSDPSRAMRQASKDISKHYYKPAAPGYDTDPVEKWAKHKLPYDTFIGEDETYEEELGLPPCDNCDESEYKRESVRKRKTLKEDHLNDKMDSYEQEKAYEDVETVVRRYGMDVELRDKSTSEDPEETLIYLDIVDGDDKLLVSRINSVGDIEVGEMRGNKFTGEPVDSVEDFIEIFVEDLTNKEREQLEMEENIEMSPQPQRAPEEQPSEPTTKPGTPDKNPPTERPSRRPFKPTTINNI